MLDGAGEKDGSEGRGVIGEATLTRGVETLSGAFKATVLIVLDRVPSEKYAWFSAGGSVRSDAASVALYAPDAVLADFVAAWWAQLPLSASVS